MNRQLLKSLYEADDVLELQCIGEVENINAMPSKVMYIHSKYTKLLLDKQLYQNATQTIYYLCPSLCFFAVVNCTNLMFCNEHLS